MSDGIGAIAGAAGTDIVTGSGVFSPASSGESVAVELLQGTRSVSSCTVRTQGCLKEMTASSDCTVDKKTMNASKDS